MWEIFYEPNMYKKGYFELPVLLCMIFVRSFVHTRESDFIIQVSVEPVYRYMWLQRLHVLSSMEEITRGPTIRIR